MAVSSASLVEVGVVIAVATKKTKEEKDEDDGGGGLAVDGGVSVSSFSIVASTPSSNATPVQPPDGGSGVDVDAEEEGREDEEGGTKDESMEGSSKKEGGESEEGDDPEEVIAVVASSIDGKVGDDNNTIMEGRPANAADDEAKKKQIHTHEQLREFCSRPDLHPILFGASNVARMAGLNPYADLPEILMKLVYQSPLGRSLLRRDCELLGLTIRSDEEELIELASKIGGGTLDNVKRALAIRRGEELPDTVHSASILKDRIRSEAVRSRKLTREEMRVLTEGTRQAVDTGFGTAHEDAGLDLYEKRVGWEVRERNSAVMEWNFVRAEDGDDECEGSAGRCDEVGDGDEGEDGCEGGDRHRGDGKGGVDSHPSASGEADSTPAADSSPAAGSDSKKGIDETGNVTEGAMIHGPLPTVVPMGPATRRVRNRKRPRTPPTPTAQSTGGCCRGSTGVSSSDADVDDGGKTSEDGCDAVSRGKRRRLHDPSLESSGPGGGGGKGDGEQDDDCGGPGTSSGSDGDGVERRGKGPPSTEVEEEAASINGDDTPSSPSCDDGAAAAVTGASSSSDPRHSSDVGDSSATAALPEGRRRKRRRPRPFFTIMGSVDGIRDELWFDPKRTKRDGPGEEKKESEAATKRPSSSSSSSKDGGSSKHANEDEEEVRADDDGWTLRPVVVECKHRMRSSSSSSAVPPPPPPLYDQVQACCYCLMYGADRADIVQVVRRRHPRRRGSNSRPPPEDDHDRKHMSSSSPVDRSDVVPSPPSPVRDRDDGDGGPTGDEDDSSSGAVGGSDGGARPPERKRRPNNPPATTPEVDVDVTVSRVDLDDPLHRHRENWHRVVLPRLRSFVEAAYAVRGDDDRRYRLLAAMCGAGNGTGENVGGGEDEEDAWRILLDECGWLADCDTAYGR